MPFDYPAPREHRRHGPMGYASYAEYRPWLRDEFSFRCVYCLKRERWGQVTGEFDIDHFEPQALKLDLAVDYSNLLYACRRCNSVKGDREVADPFASLVSPLTTTKPDGTLHGHTENSIKLILQLDLNSPRMVCWRILWMRIVELARERDPILRKNLLSFPDDLPKLDYLRPPAGNSRPEGIAESWSAIAQRGNLPEAY